MPKFVTNISTGLVRYFLVGFGTWLTTQGIASEQDVQEMYSGVALVVLTCLWMIVTKVRQARVLNTALASEPQDLKYVESLVKRGLGAPVGVPPGVQPVLPQRVYKLR